MSVYEPNRLILIIGAMIIIPAFISMICYLTRRAKIKAQTTRQQTEAFKELSAKLEANYRQTLTGTDKVAAMIAGRAYYLFIRHGHLTSYDEQAINNDLNTMN